MSTEPLHNKIARRKKAFRKRWEANIDLHTARRNAQQQVSQWTKKLQLIEAEIDNVEIYNTPEQNQKLRENKQKVYDEENKQLGIDIICDIRNDLIEKHGFYDIEHVRLYNEHLNRVYNRIKEYDISENKVLKLTNLSKKIPWLTKQMTDMRSFIHMRGEYDTIEIARQHKVNIEQDIDPIYPQFAPFRSNDRRDVENFYLDWESISKKKIPSFTTHDMSVVKSKDIAAQNAAGYIDLTSDFDEEVNTPVDHSSKILNKQVDSDVIDMSDIFGDESNLTKDFDFG